MYAFMKVCPVCHCAYEEHWTHSCRPAWELAAESRIGIEDAYFLFAMFADFNPAALD